MIFDIKYIYISLISSFAITIFLLLTKKWHEKLSTDLALGIQKSHTEPTPRIGGIPIYFGLIIACANSSEDIKIILTPILLAGIPTFLFGIAEDLTKKISVAYRLSATITSGFLAWLITDYSLTRIDIIGLDNLMQFTLISVIFTSFAVGGVANSINIIDGFNGLATLTCIIALTGLSLIALQVGDYNLSMVSLIIASSIIGLFFINWPFGKIFLGDGGAYFIGFSLAWISVLLIERNKDVSAFSALVICILPITEVLLSIYRRKIRKSNPGEPDRLHFHSILYRRYVSRWFAHWPFLATNSLVGLLVGLMSLLAAITANYLFYSTILCATAAVIMGIAYVLIYFRMIRHHWF